MASTLILETAPSLQCVQWCHQCMQCILWKRSVMKGLSLASHAHDVIAVIPGYKSDTFSRNDWASSVNSLYMCATNWNARSSLLFSEYISYERSPQLLAFPAADKLRLPISDNANYIHKGLDTWKWRPPRMDALPRKGQGRSTCLFAWSNDLKWLPDRPSLHGGYQGYVTAVFLASHAHVAMNWTVTPPE